MTAREKRIVCPKHGWMGTINAGGLRCSLRASPDGAACGETCTIEYENGKTEEQERDHYLEVLRQIAKKIVQTIDDPEEIPEDVVGMIEESGACTKDETDAWCKEVCP